MDTISKLNRLFQRIRKEFSILSGISLGIFLFVLFFQPFMLETFGFNNRLLIIAGLGLIIFLFMIIGYIILPQFARKITVNHRDAILPLYLRGFITLVLSSAAFAFYLKYVGGVSITFHIMLKIVLICVVPLLILRMYDALKELRHQNQVLLQDKKELHNRIETLEETNLQKAIVFFSENSSERLSLSISDVIMVKSADNYVEIIFKEDDMCKKKLIRNTLKNIEHQVNQCTSFVRCHRTCIVNINYVRNLFRRFNNYWLSIKDYEEQVPVSRQYLMYIKEALPA